MLQTYQKFNQLNPLVLTMFCIVLFRDHYSSPSIHFFNYPNFITLQIGNGTILKIRLLF